MTLRCLRSISRLLEIVKIIQSQNTCIAEFWLSDLKNFHFTLKTKLAIQVDYCSFLMISYYILIWDLLFYSNKIKKATKTFLKNLWKLEKMAAFYVKIIGSFFLFVRPKVFGVGNWKLFLKGLHHFWSYKASYIRGVLTIWK